MNRQQAVCGGARRCWRAWPTSVTVPRGSQFMINAPHAPPNVANASRAGSMRVAQNGDRCGAADGGERGRRVGAVQVATEGVTPTRYIIERHVQIMPIRARQKKGSRTLR